MSAPKHTAGAVYLLKRSIAFPFVAAKRVLLTADLLKSVADRNGSAVERVAVWLMEGSTVATDFCTYEVDASTPEAGNEGGAAALSTVDAGEQS